MCYGGQGDDAGWGSLCLHDGQQLSREQCVPKMIHTNLHLKAVLRSFKVGQRHQTSIEHKEINTVNRRAYIFGKRYDRVQVCKVHGFDLDICVWHGIAAESLSVDLLFKRALASLQGSACQYHAAASTTQGLDGLKANATVAAGDDGHASRELPPRHIPIHDLFGCRLPPTWSSHCPSTNHGFVRQKKQKLPASCCNKILCSGGSA
mmetsp:Transcript_36910/g.73019  ORF Transcript_36910/g.73019 Transcript_36910/m.73019 type:complete len:206 (+) Transcript_36910:801-1418(+)